MLESFTTNVGKYKNQLHWNFFSLLRLVEVGCLSNKVNGYKIKNVKNFDILSVIKMYIINRQMHVKELLQ